MSDTTRPTETRKPALASDERLSLGALLVMLGGMNVWFFSQALTYLG